MRVVLRVYAWLVAGVLGVVSEIGAVAGAILRLIPNALSEGWRAEVSHEGGARVTRRGLRMGALLAVLALVIFGAIGGAVAVVSGVIPITASSRHWPITEWFLHFTMRRSIATHSLGTEVPPLDDSALVLKGATHYETGCRPCHGSPGLRQPIITHQMTPSPPYLPPQIGELKARELFYVVKHGVKFTGMPAWPAPHRDDEVWAMVAFLRNFPALDEAEYRRLALGEPALIAPLETLGASPVPRAVVETCARCHGRDSDAFPKLAGQRAEYLQNALTAYARGDRHSGMMQPIAARLDAATIRDLARYYSDLRRDEPAQRGTTDLAAIERGRIIAHFGIPAQRVPSCVDCHEAGGKRRKPAYPGLAGQPASYLTLQLELFKQGHRGGSAYAHLMEAVAPRLTPEQMRDVARYFESLPTRSLNP